MKKTLLGIMVLVLIFSISSAFPLNLNANDSATLIVYGRLHLSLDYLDNGESSAINLSSNSSRLGFKGELVISEDLKAIYQLEGTVNADIRGGEIATRDSFVGLRGNFGTFRLGYFDTPLKTIRSRTDHFGDQIGDARNMTLGNDHRFRNSIGYTSPKFGLFTLDMQYSVDQNNSATTDNNDDWAFSTSLFIRESKYYVGLAYEIRNNGDDKHTAVRAGLSYNLNALRLTAFVQQYSVEDADAMTFGGGLAYKVNDTLTLKGQIYMVDADGDDTNGTMYAIGSDFRLSKHTLLYLAFAASQNEDYADFSSSGGGHGSNLKPAPGDNTMSISAGIRVDF